VRTITNKRTVIMHRSSAGLAGNKQVQAAYLGIWFCDKSRT
jgi:hypothetical protein